MHCSPILSLCLNLNRSGSGKRKHPNRKIHHENEYGYRMIVESHQQLSKSTFDAKRNFSIAGDVEEDRCACSVLILQSPNRYSHIKKHLIRCAPSG